MNDTDEDIYYTNLMERYANRPNELENICLAGFAADYTVDYGATDVCTDKTSSKPHYQNGDNSHIWKFECSKTWLKAWHGDKE